MKFYQQTAIGNREAKAYLDLHHGHIVQFWQDGKKISVEAFLDGYDAAMRAFWRWLHKGEARTIEDMERFL
jgi:acylphosphatase